MRGAISLMRGGTQLDEGGHSAWKQASWYPTSLMREAIGPLTSLMREAISMHTHQFE